MASMLMHIPFRIAISISPGPLFDPFSTVFFGSAPVESASVISLTPKASPPAPSWLRMWRTARPLLALLAYMTSTSA